MQNNSTAAGKPRFSCRLKASLTANFTIWRKYYWVHTLIALLIIAGAIVAIVALAGRGQAAKPTLYDGLIANAKAVSTSETQAVLDNGLTLKGSSDSFVTDLGNGLSLSCKDSLVTIKGFGSTIVSSRIIAYAPMAAGGLQISLENGVTFLINGYGKSKASEFSYTILFASDMRTITSYQGQPISEAALRSFTMDKSGNAEIVLADGTKANIAKDGKITVKTVF